MEKFRFLIKVKTSNALKKIVKNIDSTTKKIKDINIRIIILY